MLYILGDERAVSNEASNYLSRITSGNITLKVFKCPKGYEFLDFLKSSHVRLDQCVFILSHFLFQDSGSSKVNKKKVGMLISEY